MPPAGGCRWPAVLTNCGTFWAAEFFAEVYTVFTKRRIRPQSPSRWLRGGTTNPSVGMAAHNPGPT